MVMYKEKSIKELPVIIFSKNRVLGEFWVKGFAKPSVLSEVVKILNEHNVQIKNLIAYSIKGEEVAFIIVDLTDIKGDVNEVISKMKALPNVSEVDFFSPKHYGCVYEAFGFPITSSGFDENIIMRLRSFIDMLEGIKACFGSAGEAFLWYLARDGGSSTAKWFNSNLESLDVEDKIKIHLAALFSAGWGKFELKRFDWVEKVIEIEAIDNLEVKHKKGIAKNPRCTFIRGYLTGLLSVYLGKNVRVEEVECEAKKDGRCLFVCYFG
ncbi:MAG: V4R domain-containing protein [Candidatus Nezhaarchaeales archaeon]